MIKKRLKKKQQQKKNELDITINQTLIFSATMIIIFTITMIIIFCNYQSVPDALIAGFFAVFGVEGGYLTYIHKLKKERQNKGNIQEIMEEQDDSELVIDDEGEC